MTTGDRDAVSAGLIAAVVSGIPSTVWTLVRGGDVLEGARAAGSILLPGEHRTGPLLVAAVPVHLALSVGWALILARLIPRGREPVYGTLGGLAIAALDLGVIGRRIPRVRALAQPPQWLDHAAYGLAVGMVLRSAFAGKGGHGRDRGQPRSHLQTLRFGAR